MKDLQGLYKNKTGSTLIMVLIVFMVMTILCAAALTQAAVSSNVTASEITKQQADFAAKSAAKSVISYIQNDTTGQLETKIESLGTSSVSGSTVFTGKHDKNGNPINCAITLTGINANLIKVTATSNYNGTSGKAVVYLTKSQSDPHNPFSNLVYTAGDVSFQGNTNFNGSLYSNTNISIGGNVSLNNGTIIALGSLTIQGSVSGAKLLETASNITLNDTVSGDIYAKGSVNFNGKAYVQGSAYVGYPQNMSASDKAKVAHDVKLFPAGLSIQPIASPTVTFPSTPASYQYSNAPHVINGDGAINSGNTGILNDGKAITVNTEASPVYMFLDGLNGITWSNNLTVVGKNNLYIFMHNTVPTLSGVTIHATDISGNTNTTNTKIFFIGDSGCNNFTIHGADVTACIVLSGGKVTLEKGQSCKFTGSIDSNQIDVSNNIDMFYLPPDLSNPDPINHPNPFSSYAQGVGGGGGGSGGNSTWSVNGWAAS